MIILKIDIEGIFTFKSKCQAPVAADDNTPRATSIAFQLVQAITRQVYIPYCAGVVEDVQLSF